MYAPFGIGFNRALLIRNYGASNVIYGDTRVKEMLPKELLWRYENLNMDSYDFEWLREWRIEGGEDCSCFDFRTFPKNEIIIVTKDEKSLAACVRETDFDVESDYAHEMQQSYPHLVIFDTRKWKGLTLDQIKEISDDYGLSAYTQTQIIGERLDD